MNFSDNRKWGSRTYLDYLEFNGIEFTFDGTTLSFPSSAARERAVSIWYALTGMRTIGKFADGDNAN